MLSYATPATIACDNAEADRIMASKGYNRQGQKVVEDDHAAGVAEHYAVPHGVATAARTLKQAHETIPQFLARIGYKR